MATPNDLDLLHQVSRVFNVFDSLPKNHQDQIIPSVSKMAKGMAFFQNHFQFGEITPLKNIQDLEEYCYFVAGVVGEMLCNLFFPKTTSLARSSAQYYAPKCRIIRTRTTNDQHIQRYYCRS